MTRLIEDTKYDFKDVLLVPQRSTLSSRSEVSLEREFTFKNSGQQYKGIPIIAANMDGVGTFELAKALSDQGLFTALVKHYSAEELIKFYIDNGTWANTHTAVSMGISKEDLDRFNEVKNTIYIKTVCVDVANGYQQNFVKFIEKLRKDNPILTIIAGNVVTKEMTNELILAGADIVKVGIGPGSACSTRIKTGVGYPQLSAVMECADAAHGLGGHIISDGGCSCPGDVAKAFAAGADFVMLGGMFAGCDEGGGKIISKDYLTNELSQNFFIPVMGRVQEKQTKKTVEFYGMSSKKAQEVHGNGLADYRASEGRVISVPYKGPVNNVVQDILGGLRSTCTYLGAKKLKELSRRATFIKVNQQFNSAFGVGEI